MMYHKLVTTLCLALFTGLVLGSPGIPTYLTRNKVLCDTEKIACLRATVVYEEATFTVRGRVTKVKSPGILLFIFRPTNIDQEECGIVFDDYAVLARLEVPLRGHVSEIVDKEAHSGYHRCVTQWKLCCIVFREKGDESIRCLPEECAG